MYLWVGKFMFNDKILLLWERKTEVVALQGKKTWRRC